MSVRSDLNLDLRILRCVFKLALVLALVCVASGHESAAAPVSTCGNGSCQASKAETCITCPVDCGACPSVCGNASCEADETCTTCAGDCGACPIVCGNGSCQTGETCSSCAADCGTCPPVCGNASCESGENCSSCAADCGACIAVCGNASCEAGETCTSCADDCGACPAVCGNASCETGETCSSCAADCGACPASCGNGNCQASKDENCNTCAADCGACEPVCGDETCETSEEPEGTYACAADCSPGCDFCDLSDANGDCTAIVDECLSVDCSSCDFNLDGACLAASGECSPASCGDAICQSTEDCTACAADCGACDAPPSGIASACTPDPAPDELDVFRVEGVTDEGGLPHIMLLVDNSCSMNGGSHSTDCTWFAANHNGGDTHFKKIQLLQATLVGCKTEDDGLFDIFENRIVFALRTMSDKGGGGDPNLTGDLLADFTTNKATLESAITDTLDFTSGTPITKSLRTCGVQFNDSVSDSNTYGCATDAITMIGDGSSTGSSGTDYDWACDNYDVNLSQSEPHLGAQYMVTHDVLCSLSGTQHISTYGVGLMTNANGRAEYQQITGYGQGQYYDAVDIPSLQTALLNIFTIVASRSAVVGFAAPSIQREGVFYTGQYGYFTYFKPQESGMFRGNLKKICILPTFNGATYDTTQTSCLFKSTTGTDLLTNEEAVDTWTGESDIEADVGGSGSLLKLSLGDADGTPSGPSRPRNIMTYRPGTSGYVSLQPANWTAEDAWVAESRLAGFINRMHGYTWDADDSGDPLAVHAWPLADSVHAPAILLPYGDCESAGNCFVAFGGNTGMLHFFDTATGQETGSLIPGEIWRPGNVPNNILKHIEDQPSPEGIHRYYVDGGMRLYHEDDDLDGIIDASETAYLILGLGRGGRAYYKIPVSTFSGTPDDTNNPVYPLPWSSGNSWNELRETWAPPFVTKSDITGSTKRIAVFPSGHVARFDFPETLVPGEAEEAVTITTSQVACLSGAAGIAPSPCNQWYVAGYTDPAGSAIYGPVSITDAVAYRVHFSNFEIDPNDIVYLSDSDGYAGAALTSSGDAAESWSSALDGGWSPWIYDHTFNITLSGNGTDTADRGWEIDLIEAKVASFGVKYGNDLTCAGGCRWCDLASTPDGECTNTGDECLSSGPLDCSVCDYDGDGQCTVASSIGRQECGLGCTWCDSDADGICEDKAGECAPTGPYDCSICDTVVVNGICRTSEAECHAESVGATSRTGPTGVHYPSVFITGLDNWNGTAGGNAFGNAATTEALLVQIARQCPAGAGGPTTCVNATDNEDLVNLTCPISAEISVYGTGGDIDTLYWGDECGQLWKAWVIGTTWSARRLLNTNEADFSDQANPQASSKDVRKIFRKLDVVVSNCPGVRVVGLYFGTGNLQRPNKTDELENGTVVPGGRDIMGVFWDNGTHFNQTMGDLQDITESSGVDPKTMWADSKVGWYIQLLDDEKMLRDPLVFDGVAYFKTHAPGSGAAPVCGNVAGTDRAYAIDNCSGDATVDSNDDGTIDNSDRSVRSESDDIGSGFLLLTPKSGAPFVSIGSNVNEEAAKLGPENSRRTMRIFLWREPRDH